MNYTELLQRWIGGLRTVTALSGVLFLLSCSTTHAQSMDPGLGVEPSSTSSVTKKVHQASHIFMANVRLDRMRQRSVKPFTLAIDEQGFLGEPAVANLGSCDGRYYYLVLLHYNIPTLKACLIPGRYAFARFSTRFVVYPNYDGESKRDLLKASQKPGKVDLIAIYPVNDLLSVEHTDKGTNTFHVEPKYQEASAGYYEYSKERTDQYNFDLPKVIGSADRFGTAAWTYYPAKLQPLILGTKTAMAVISFGMDKPAGEKAPPAIEPGYILRLECALDYQLRRLWTMPGIARSVKDVLIFDLSKAPKLEQFLNAHKVDIPDDVISKINEGFRDVHQFTVSSSKNDYVVDSTQGKLYRLDDAGAHCLLPERK